MDSRTASSGGALEFRGSACVSEGTVEGVIDQIVFAEAILSASDAVDLAEMDGAGGILKIPEFPELLSTFTSLPRTTAAFNAVFKCEVAAPAGGF